MMNSGAWQLFTISGSFITLLFITGLYCILVTRNLIRIIIGLELLIKAVTLLFILVGYVTNQTALLQSLVITIIVIEVVITATAGGIALGVFRQNDNLDAKKLGRLRG